MVLLLIWTKGVQVLSLDFTSAAVLNLRFDPPLLRRHGFSEGR